MINWQSFCTHDDRQICGFFGDYRFLSNFHVADILFEGRMYKSTEHAYHAAKCIDINDRLQFADFATTCATAKRLGQTVNLRSDWEQIKFDVMLMLTIDKYTRHSELREKLLATGGRYLEETNNWGDVFWGVDIKRGGQNRLGEILMRVRDLLQPPMNPTSPTLWKFTKPSKYLGEF